MILARAIERIASFLVLVLLALLGLAVAIAAIDPAGVTGLMALPALRDEVGGWFDALAADGPIALASALAGAGAVVLGLMLLAGLIVPRRERLVRLASTSHGRLDARRRPLAQMAGHLTEQARGVTHSRTKVKARRRGGGRLRVRADRSRSADGAATREAVIEQLRDLTGPFELRATVRTRLGDRGTRVQ